MMTNTCGVTAATGAKVQRDVDAVIESVGTARALLARDSSPLARQADDLLFPAGEAARRVASTLSEAGFPRPTEAPASSLSLSALANLDTRAARFLLLHLESALRAAEAVDAERGNALPAELPLQPGESRGTDYAEAVSNLLLRLRREVEGAKGRD